MAALANLTNPATVNNRIYVGNLSQSATPALLEAKFSLHGKILGISKKAPSFCFIEFSDDTAAKAAIELENESFFCGRKLVVKKVSLNQDSYKRKFDETQNGADATISSKIKLFVTSECNNH